MLNYKDLKYYYECNTEEEGNQTLESSDPMRYDSTPLSMTFNGQQCVDGRS